MTERENKIQLINEKINQLYDQIDVLIEERKDIELFSTKTVNNKYWKINRPGDSLLYMKCKDCFISGPDVVLRGECFWYNDGSEDCTFFHFDTYYEIEIDKNNWNNVLNLYMTELTVEQYKEILHSGLEQFDTKYWG